MFSKILIANRGEIACRVAATARNLGIKTVAVYSQADAQSKHVSDCDEAVLLGAAPAKESYLLGDKIIAAALATGVQAIHPGYGFLSENADFADACHAAGLVFIGPPASAIRAMGSKSAAKQLMEQAHVPLVPGYHGDNQDAAFLHAQADKIGYPVLLKASAGGGGKGMRVIDNSADFLTGLASCQREAINAFGDDKVLVEKYLQRPRHIEIQVFADSLGNCVYLFERDCSVQRRHQKVVEEAPAPNMSPERRLAMGQAAVAAAKAVGYVGAGTVEFIANQDGSFYFMEMNTRLQVEHPVTEMITGTDLVEWQLRVANGESLPKQQTQLSIHGHALEARIYAENPEKGFLPSIGTLDVLHTPDAVNFDIGQNRQPAAVRIDSGVRQGDTITPFYDPMIAKLIVWGSDREQALARMSQALAAYKIVGLSTNIGFLKRLMQSHAFASANLDTGLIERHHDALFPAMSAPSLSVLALAIAYLLRQEHNQLQSELPNNHVNSPWTNSAGWRMNSRLQRTITLQSELGEQVVNLTYDGHKSTVFELSANQQTAQIQRIEDAHNQAQSRLLLQINGQTVAGDVFQHGTRLHVFNNGAHVELDYHHPLLQAAVAEQQTGRLTAPMPGKIIAVLVTAGQAVKQGAPLLIMEAMKMEHTITAPKEGIIKTVLYQVGDQVTDGAQLLGFE